VTKPTKWTATEIERRGKLAHRKWLEKHYPEIANKTATAPAATAETSPDQSNAQANALEAALVKTPHGRRLLALLTEAAKWRIHEQLTAELVSSATEKTDQLRRTLLTTSDVQERHRVAYSLPQAEAELAKWKRAHSDYKRRRELTEYAIRDGMRAFA
jgi:hypothetical protein